MKSERWIIRLKNSHTVGGTNAAARNVLSGNRDAGLWITGAGVVNNLVQGKFHGLD